MTSDVTWHAGDVDRNDRARITGGPGCTVWLTGLSASGKSSIAHAVESALIDAGRSAYTLDGDNVRHGINADLGFTPEDRAENVRRIGEIALLMADAGLVVMAPLISPYESDRQRVRKRHEDAGIPFRLVHVATPIEVCRERDPKGLYAAAEAGRIDMFTGVSAPYESPPDPDLVVDTSVMSHDDAVAAVMELTTL